MTSAEDAYMRNSTQFVLTFASVIALLAGAGCAQQASPAAKSPDDIISAWSAVACPGAEVKAKAAAGDLVKGAYCDLPNDSFSSAQRRQAIDVYATPAGLKSKLASVNCKDGFLRVVGDNWYAVTLVREIATGLQDKAGGHPADC